MSAITKFLLKIPAVHNVVNRAALAYQGSVAAELRRYGLRYDDLLNEFDDDVKEALAKLPPHEKEMRYKRLKRAIDLDVKSTYLPENLQEDVDVWNPYLTERVEKLKEKRMEQQIYE